MSFIFCMLISSHAFSNMLRCILAQAGILKVYCLLFEFTGQRFALREGGRTVGAGVVSKVLN